MNVDISKDTEKFNRNFRANEPFRILASVTRGSPHSCNAVAGLFRYSFSSINQM